LFIEQESNDANALGSKSLILTGDHDNFTGLLARDDLRCGSFGDELGPTSGALVGALGAIEERMQSCIEYGGVEHIAVVNGRRTLAVLKMKSR
jgi:hypothetical protein